MAHLLVAVDSHIDLHKKFKKWLSELELENSEGRPRKLFPREIKLYNIAYYEEVEEQLLELLKSLEYSRFSESRLIKLAKKFIDIEDVDMSDVKAKEFDKDFWAHVNIIGKVKDRYNHHGKEGEELI